MSTAELADSGGSLEECIDAVESFIASLANYPDAVVAHALQIHLGALLRSLRESGLCTRAQAQEFIDDLGREVL